MRPGRCGRCERVVYEVNGWDEMYGCVMTLSLDVRSTADRDRVYMELRAILFRRIPVRYPGWMRNSGGMTHLSETYDFVF